METSESDALLKAFSLLSTAEGMDLEPDTEREMFDMMHSYAGLLGDLLVKLQSLRSVKTEAAHVNLRCPHVYSFPRFAERQWTEVTCTNALSVWCRFASC